MCQKKRNEIQMSVNTVCIPDSDPFPHGVGRGVVLWLVPASKLYCPPPQVVKGCPGGKILPPAREWLPRPGTQNLRDPSPPPRVLTSPDLHPLTCWLATFRGEGWDYRSDEWLQRCHHSVARASGPVNPGHSHGTMRPTCGRTTRTSWTCV